MAADIIIGAQWGDEGKGKIVDTLSEKYDAVVRYQGGANAGHTVVIGDKKFVLHLLPTGIFHKNKINIIANGVVVDIDELVKEIDLIEKAGIRITPSNLMISENASVVAKYHKILDTAKEGRKNDKKIGTTGRGIGPTYVDKYARIGIKVKDIFDDKVLIEKIKENLYEKNFILKNLYGEKEINEEEIFNELIKHRKRIKPFVKNTIYELNNLLLKGKNILFEGAQGALLDIDFGTYPYVTSSNPTVGGALTGSGISFKYIKKVYGICKAYQTRVGNGPFPSEMESGIAEEIRQKGGEFGATTGRPRRCGWLDLVSLKYSCILNGLTDLIITKIDVLSGLDKIKVVTDYNYNGEKIKKFLADANELAKCKPVFKIFPGWNKDLSSVKKYADMPVYVKKYIEFIEKYTGVKVSYVSVGPERRQILKK